MPRSAGNVVNIMVFVRFPVFEKVGGLGAPGEGWVSFGRVSGDPGVTFSCF